MGEAKRKAQIQNVYRSLKEEVEAAIQRFQERKGCNPSRIFLGRLEVAVVSSFTGEDPHGKILKGGGLSLSLPVWSMKSAKTMVDVG